MTLSGKKLCDFGFYLYITFALFSDLISQIWGGRLRYVIWGTALLLTALPVIRRGKLTRPKWFLAVSAVTVFAVVFRNHGLAAGSYATTFRWLFCFVFLMLAVDAVSSYESAVKYLVCAGTVHVAAVYYFWLVPSAYSSMYRIWGYWPSGTAGGRQGYKAALTNHYSHNGIVLAVVCLALFSLILESKVRRKKSRVYMYCILFALALFAVVLTTKRAHLIFGAASLAVVYYLCDRKQRILKSIRLIAAGLTAAVGIILFSRMIPEVQQLLSRFSAVENDATMQSRFQFWDLAFRMFLERPVFGHGWFAFRYQYNESLYDTSVRAARYELLDCHNVYLQILAETGLAGFLFYISVTGYLLWTTLKMLRAEQNSADALRMGAPLYFSAFMQVFFMMYSMTGNCLYDITSAFYFTAVTFVLGEKYRRRSVRCPGEEKI